jgi:hypothetical protein
MWILRRKVLVPWLKREEYIYYDGENGYCTYCMDLNRAIKYKSFVDAHIGTSGLVELWGPVLEDEITQK